MTVFEFENPSFDVLPARDDVRGCTLPEARVMVSFYYDRSWYAGVRQTMGLKMAFHWTKRSPLRHRHWHHWHWHHWCQCHHHCPRPGVASGVRDMRMEICGEMVVGGPRLVDSPTMLSPGHRLFVPYRRSARRPCGCRRHERLGSKIRPGGTCLAKPWQGPCQGLPSRALEAKSLRRKRRIGVIVRHRVPTDRLIYYSDICCLSSTFLRSESKDGARAGITRRRC